MERPQRGAARFELDLAEELSDDRNDRDDGRGDPEKTQTEHERLNGPAHVCVRRAA